MNALREQLLEGQIGVLRPADRRHERLGEWFSAEYRPLLRFAYFVCGDADTAQDLVQDAFVRIGRTNTARVEDAGFGAYARRTIVNLARSRFRRLVTERRALPRLWERDVTPGPDVEARDEMWSAILRLSPQQRAIVALRFYEHMTEADIAASLGVSGGTVKKQLSRALNRLRNEAGAPAREETSP